MREFYRKNKILIQKAAFLIFLILSVYFFINTLFVYVAPFVIGYIISVILDPLVSLLHKRFKIPRGISGLVLIIIVILLLVILGTSIVTRISVEARSFAENLPQYIEDGREFFTELQEELTRYIDIVPDRIQTVINESSGNIVSNLTASLTSVLGSGVGQGGISLVRKLPTALVFLVLCIISAFFFTKDKHLVEKSVKAALPEWIKRNIGSIKEGIFKALIGYIKAQLIIMSVTGTICIVGLTIIKYPYALLVGLIIALFDALPIFGSGAILWPWALYNVLNKNYSTAVGLIIIYGSIFFTRQFLEPKVLASQIGIHPLLTLMSMYAGLRIFGVLGFIIGPLVVICTKIILESDLNLSQNAVEDNIAKPEDNGVSDA